MDSKYKFTSEQLIAEGRTTKQHIETITTWLLELKDKNVPSRIKDEKLILFLLSCNNDIESTQNTIISYYYCKRNAPEIHDGWDIERDDLKNSISTLHFCTIPLRTEENYAIHFYKIHDTNYKNFHLLPLLKSNLMLSDITLNENPPNGLIYLIDIKGLNLMHMTRFKMDALAKYFQFIQEGVPLQMKAIHVINSVYVINKLMALFKLCMKNELFSLIHIYPSGISEDKLFEILPKKYLPAEYGGDLPSEKVLHEITLRQLKEKQEFWMMEEKLRKQCQ